MSVTIAEDAEYFVGDRTITEAEKCCALAYDATRPVGSRPKLSPDSPDYYQLFQHREFEGREVVWCVVTRKGLWPPSFNLDESKLRSKLGRGHRVVLTVGIAGGMILCSETGYKLVPVDHLLPREKMVLARKAVRVARF
jgi:hypothetical protein